MSLLKDLPSLKSKLEVTDRNRLLRLREARDARNLKCIAEAWAEEKLKPKILSDKQRQAIYLLTDFVHDFTDKYIYTRIDVSPHEFYKWRNDPLFLRELDKEITRRKSYIRIWAFRNVHRAIRRGDMNATWKYLKMSGDLKEHIEIIDRTGEHELSEAELNEEILNLTAQLANANVPSGN